MDVSGWLSMYLRVWVWLLMFAWGWSNSRGISSLLSRYSTTILSENWTSAGRSKLVSVICFLPWKVGMWSPKGSSVVHTVAQVSSGGPSCGLILNTVYCSFLDRPGRTSDRVWTVGGDVDQPLRESIYKLVKGVLSDVVCVVILAHFLVCAYSIEED